MNRRPLLFVVPILLAAAVLLYAHSSLAKRDARRLTPAAGQSTSPAAEAKPTSSASDRQFALEIRRFGVTVDMFRQRALLSRLDEVGPSGQLLPQDPKEFPWSARDRSTAARLRENNVFEYALRGWVDFWPIPVIVAGPPRDVHDSSADRMATHISAADNGAGVTNAIYIRLDELHTEHGDDVQKVLFDFFDRHPDLPAALVLIEDGLRTRAYMRTPGADYLDMATKDGNAVPQKPDSFVTLLVTRKDRVDRMIRPYVVKAPEQISSDDTKYDVIKLWNYFWAQQRAYRAAKEGNEEMPWDYWQQKLPEFWSKNSIHIPQGFKPNPWVPVPWTEWQLKEYDDAPVLAYLHRPIEINLSDAHGQPLKKAERIAKIKEGWAQAQGTLATGDAPSRIFYDTGSTPGALPLLVQSLHDNAQHIDLDDPKDAFDMARRIGDTGISSQWVQIAMALMRGYGDGKTSAAIDMRDPLRTSIIMVTPPAEASRKAAPQLFSFEVS